MIVTVAHEFGMFARWQRRLRRRLFANDVYCAGVSQAVVDEMHGHGVPPARTLTLPNPADVARFDAALLPRNTARERLGMSPESYVVGVVGRLHPKKRPHLALDGFARTGDDSHLAFIGDGELRDALESSATRLGVTSRVHFTGRVADASRYAAAFDAMVVASVPEEAFGMALLEAMLAGVPVVCADVPGPRSVLGPEGLYFTGDAAGLTTALRRCAALSVEQRAGLSAMQRDRAVRLFSLEATARAIAHCSVRTGLAFRARLEPSVQPQVLIGVAADFALYHRIDSRGIFAVVGAGKPPRVRESETTRCALSRHESD